MRTSCPCVPLAHPSATTPQMMKTSSWLKKGRDKNDHEASSSSSQRFGRLSAFLRGTSLSSPPRPEDFRGRHVEARLPPRAEGERRERQYFRIAECECRWREGRGIRHNDVSLSTGWHLNRDRVPLPPVPKEGKGLEEIHRRIRGLPSAQRWDAAYQSEAYWKEFLDWKHKVRRATTIRHDLQSGKVYPIPDIYSNEEGAVNHSDAEFNSEDGNDEGGDDDKQEAVDDVAANLSPEYHEVLTRGYDKDAFIEKASAQEEEAQWRGYKEALELTRMVAETNAQLPSPLLPVWTPPIGRTSNTVRGLCERSTRLRPLLLRPAARSCSGLPPPNLWTPSEYINLDP